MKILVPLLSLLLASPSFADTAQQAYSAFASTGAGAQLKVIEIAGMNGVDQPTAWRVTAENRSGQVTDYLVRNGSLYGSQASTAPLGQRGINASRVRFDSTHAFERANAAARRAKVGFESVNYRLRATSASNSVWLVQLVAKNGSPVGLVSVGANTGRVVSTQFRPETAHMQASPVESSGGVFANGASRTIGALRGLFSR